MNTITHSEIQRMIEANDLAIRKSNEAANHSRARFNQVKEIVNKIDLQLADSAAITYQLTEKIEVLTKVITA